MMSFIWPAMLLCLLLIPLFVIWYVRWQRQRRRFAANFGTWGLVRPAPSAGPGRRRHIAPALFLVGLSILTLGLARPQAAVSLPRQEGTVILAFDVSGSMAATDLEPTRMEAAKAAARGFLERLPRSVQVGIVAFSDGGLSVQAPTNDQDTVLAAINRLSPARGTSVGQGILASLRAISAEADQTQHAFSNLTPVAPPSPTPVPSGTYTSAVIVLLTDGENNQSPDPLAAARAAAERGVRIYAVGIGSAAGTTLHVNGFTVHTQLNEAGLQQIAELTQGAYFSAENAQDLRTIYDNLDPQLVVKPEDIELTSIFAGASIFILLLGGLFSLLWFGRLP